MSSSVAVPSVPFRAPDWFPSFCLVIPYLLPGFTFALPAHVHCQACPLLHSARTHMLCIIVSCYASTSTLLGEKEMLPGLSCHLMTTWIRGWIRGAHDC